MSDYANYTPPQKKIKVGLIVTIVVLVLALCCVVPIAVVGGLGFKIFGNAKGFVSCSMSMTEMRDAMLDYAKDHGGKLPPAATWEDDIVKYDRGAISQPGFEVPPITSDVCDKASVTSVSYNSDLAGKKIASIKDPESTMVLFEVTGKGRNQSGKYTQRPATSSPAFIFGESRGWVEIPVKGAAGLLSKNGFVPINGNRTGKGSIQINTNGQ